jgi:hypothetical protein
VRSGSTALLVLYALLLGSPPGLAQEVLPSDAGVEVVVEVPTGEPVEQEMLLLSVRGTYDAKLNVALSELAQPDLSRFGWMQLGRDRWGRAVIDGRQVRTFERRLAVFPQRPGRLEVGSFTHRLTLASGDGRRVPHEVRSAPISVTTRAKPAGPGWWLPAREVRITDAWDRAPDRLIPGDMARRTVTLEAVGVAPQFLPPAPELKGAGLIIFTDPEERTTEITPDGPVSRVTWRWTVRPKSSTSTELSAVTIPWFDTNVRRAREVVLAPQSIGFAAEIPTQAAQASRIGFLAGHATAVGVALGLVCGLGLLLPGRRMKSWRELGKALNRVSPSPEVWDLKRAVRRGQALAARRAAYRLIARDRTNGRPGNPRSAALLRGLDKQLFAPDRALDEAGLQAFARAFLRERRGNRVVAG